MFGRDVCLIQKKIINKLFFLLIPCFHSLKVYFCKRILQVVLLVIVCEDARKESRSLSGIGYYVYEYE